MSPFEVVHGYKHGKPLDLVLMSPYIRVYVGQSSHLYVKFRICMLRSLSKFKQVMHNINFELICIDDTMNLMLGAMLWYMLDPNGILRKLIENFLHVVLDHSKCCKMLVQMLMLLIYCLILTLAAHLILKI